MKGLKRRVYGLAGGTGVLATVLPADIGWTLPRRVVQQLRVPTRARVSVQFFPGGPWDLAAEPFDIHRYVREIFVEGVPVQQSAQYQDMVARLADPNLGGSVWGCRTVADVERYFEHLHAMYDDIRINGYRRQGALGGTRQDEVKVRIGRDGRLIKASGGNHRVSFAKLLDVERIPVLLCGIHKEYVGRVTGADDVCDGRALGEVLESAGFEGYGQSDMDALVRRLTVQHLSRRVARVRRRVASRPGISEGSWGLVSLYDDLHVLQPTIAQGLLAL